jgi:putative phosphoesterase
VRVGVVADTHLRRGWARRLPDAAVAELAAADVILHAGDLVIPEVLEQLGQLAPVHAVLGNNDTELVGTLDEEVALELEGVRVAMVHDSGPRAGREARLHRRFPDADVVVFGHSHIPWDAAGVDGQWLLNPGSPTERRRQPSKTMATMDLAGGRLVGTRIVVLDD